MVASKLCRGEPRSEPLGEPRGDSLDASSLPFLLSAARWNGKAIACEQWGQLMILTALAIASVWFVCAVCGELESDERR